MKKRNRILIAALILSVFVAVSSFAVLAANDAGSDLPVSESYVLKVLNALEQRLTKKIDALSSTVSDLSDNSGSSASPSSLDYSIEYLKKGQKLIGNCEIILRSGTASAVCPGVNGISDLTIGDDLPNGTDISWNHLLLVPRADGRGIQITSAEAYVMVRGTYHIEK